jgi:Mg/Co/Ni transporter MgtE
MSDKIYLTDEQIERITSVINSLDTKERHIVEQMLERIKSGGIYKTELERELEKLRRRYLISDIDRRNIEEAIFGKK